MNSNSVPLERLWSVNGSDVPNPVRNSFLQVYELAIQNHSSAPLLTNIDSNGVEVTTTFSDFDFDVSRASQVIAELSPSENIVMIVAKNTYESLVFMIGALVIGRTICPVNPEEGVERILQKIANIGLPTSVWVDSKKGEFGIVPSFIPLSLKSEINSEIPIRRKNFRRGQPAILIFTSGSTGYSKIVKQTEEGLLSNADALIAHHNLGIGTVLATPLPTFHVNALEFSFMCSLLSGTHLVLFEMFDPEQIFSAIDRYKVQILSLVPPLLRLLLGRKSQITRFDLRSLRYVVTAAAPLDAELIRKTLSLLKVPVIQGYGLSEAINFTCLMPIDLKATEYEKWMFHFAWPSIGRAVEGNFISLLDQNCEQVAEGQTGELCIRGPVVMSGYMHDETAKVFEGSYLHTGDLAQFHFSDSGERFYFIVGRIKDTIKRYGMTLSLREIDDSLLKFDHSGIDLISVGFKNDWSGEDVGVVIRHQSPPPRDFEDRFLAFIETALPQHMRPRLIFDTNVELRTASGKPCRWQFTRLFEPHRQSLLAPPTEIFHDPGES